MKTYTNVLPVVAYILFNAFVLNILSANPTIRSVSTTGDQENESRSPYEVTFNVDMTDADDFNPATHNVYLTGTFTGWAMPGSPGSLEMNMVKNDDQIVFTVTTDITAGHHEYKYFSNAFGSGWAGGEWPGDPNRTVNVTQNMTINNIWGIIEEVESFSVTFVIVDEQDNPITDATVKLGATENSPGDYVFDEVIPGFYYYSATKDGFITYMDKVQVIDDDLLIEITLSPGENPQHQVFFRTDMTEATAAGRVAFDPDIHEVYVSGTFNNWTTPGEDSNYMLQALEGAENVYFIELEMDAAIHEYKYFLVEEEAGWDMGEWAGGNDRTILVNKNKTVFNLFGTPTIHLVEFEVVNLNNETINNAVITILNIQHEPGNYTYNYVAPGTYDYSVARAGYISSFGQFEVDDSDLLITVTLEEDQEPSYVVSFFVENEAGEPILNAVITLDDNTNEAGNYVFEYVKPGTHNFMVKKDGYFDAEGQIEVIDQDVVHTVTMFPDESNLVETPALNIILFPNPANTSLHVQSADEIIQSIAITDMSGRLLYNTKVKNYSYNVDVTSFTSGIFFIRINTKKASVVKMVMINK